MSSTFKKVDLIFEFFKERRKGNECFSIDDMAAATGWGASTVRTYVAKRWRGFLDRVDTGFLLTNRFDAFNADSFRQHHSQTDNVALFFYQLLVEKAVTACVSAIELYNKPDFKFREESFSILMVNAWELLFKARILQDNKDDKRSIQILRNGTPELSVSGNPKTISVSRALNLLESTGGISKLVGDNVRLLIEIRDESVHFVHTDRALGVKIQSIGTASLKNFMTLSTQWFGYDFTRFNFYLMPVSFFHLSDVTSFSVAGNVRDNLLKYLTEIEEQHDDEDDPNFSISLRLETRLVKSSSEEAIQVRVTDDPDAPEIQISEEDALKHYPHTYRKLCELLRGRYTDFKQNGNFNELMRSLKGQGEKFCKERKLDPANPNSIYKTFYHNRIFSELDRHYTRRK